MLYDLYPPKNYLKLGNEAREFAFVWVSANTLMQKSVDLLQNGPKTPPLGASFLLYTQ